MIRKRVCEAVRKTGEQQIYEADDRAQAKTRCKTACATCQTQQVCTQVIGMNGPICGATTFPVRVLSQRERGILRRLGMQTRFQEPYELY